jgi:hypothetical protein
LQARYLVTGISGRFGGSFISGRIDNDHKGNIGEERTMSQRDLILTILKRGAGMLPRHLADFTDEDMLARPVSGANHVAWQLSHIAHYTSKLLSTLGLEVPHLARTLPDGGRDASHLNEPEYFPRKADFLEYFTDAYDELIGLVEMLSDEQLSSPCPGGNPDSPQSLAYHLLMQPMHMTMHIGQIQVIRRSLKKPVLF